MPEFWGFVKQFGLWPVVTVVCVYAAWKLFVSILERAEKRLDASAGRINELTDKFIGALDAQRELQEREFKEMERTRDAEFRELTRMLADRLDRTEGKIDRLHQRRNET